MTKYWKKELSIYEERLSSIEEKLSIDTYQLKKLKTGPRDYDQKITELEISLICLSL